MAQLTVDPTAVFVGGLPQGANVEELTGYFQAFGALETVRIEKGFAVVKYYQTDTVALVLKLVDNHHIRGKWVEVKTYQHSKPAGGAGGMFPPEPAGTPVRSPGPYGSGFGSSPYGGAATSGPSFSERKVKSVDGNKIFVGGVPRDCTDQLLFEYFSQFGSVILAENKRGFANVHFASAEEARFCLFSGQHNLMGRDVEVKPFAGLSGPSAGGASQGLAGKGAGRGGAPPGMPTGNPSAGYGPVTGHQPNFAVPFAPRTSEWGARPAQVGGPEWVFVGGLPSSCTSEEVLGYFGAFGNVEFIETKKGFANVKYSYAEEVEAVMSVPAESHAIRTKWVDVKRFDRILKRA